MPPTQSLITPSQQPSSVPGDATETQALRAQLQEQDLRIRFLEKELRDLKALLAPILQRMPQQLK